MNRKLLTVGLFKSSRLQVSCSYYPVAGCRLPVCSMSLKMIFDAWNFLVPDHTPAEASVNNNLVLPFFTWNLVPGPPSLKKATVGKNLVPGIWCLVLRF